MPDRAAQNAEPKISVLMITYNHEKLIAKAIDSVLMQKTNFPFELVIGDDCSTDGSRGVVREYSRKYPGIVRALLRERNMGACENSRDVFFACRGKYLALLEGDDYWTSTEKLQMQADLLDTHPETAMCAHRVVCRYDDNSQPDETAPDLPAGFYSLEHLLQRHFVYTGSVMFRRVIDDIRPEWARQLAMGDLPLFVELAQHGNICLLEEVMGVYRVHGGGCWTGIAAVKRDQNNLAMWEAFYENLGPRYRQAIRKRIYHSCYCLGKAQFAAGRPDETRRCLRECLEFSGPFESLPQKASLAIKGFGWWAFPLWRWLRRLWHPAGNA
jgi:glycosyltransferase involved in cell wall biosynthesis